MVLRVHGVVIVEICCARLLHQHATVIVVGVAVVEVKHMVVIAPAVLTAIQLVHVVGRDVAVGIVRCLVEIRIGFCRVVHLCIVGTALIHLLHKECGEVDVRVGLRVSAESLYHSHALSVCDRQRNLVAFVSPHVAVRIRVTSLGLLLHEVGVAAKAPCVIAVGSAVAALELC